MAITLISSVQIPGSQNGGTSGNIDTSGATLLVVSGSQYSGATAPTPSDSKSNTWSIWAGTQGIYENLVALWIANQPPTVGSGHNFTYYSVSAYPATQCAAFGGVGNPDPDAVVGANGQGVTTLQPGTITPSQNGCLILTNVSATGASTTFSIDSGFTIIDQSAYNAGVSEGGALAYLIQGTAAPVNPTWTMGGTAFDSATTISAFLPLAAGGGKPFPYYDQLRKQAA